MLLVHHHQREPRQGGERREARAEHDAGLAARRREPGRRARHVLQGAVQQRNVGFGKGVAETRFELRREADLRHQHQHLAAFLEHPCDQAQVDLGLAAARDAVEEERLEAPERAANAFDGLQLVRGRRVAGDETGRGRLRRCGLEDLLRQRLERLQPGRQGADHRLAERALVVRSEETHEFEPLRRQARRVLEHARHRLEFFRRNRTARALFDHHADAIARAERHDDAVAGNNIERLRSQVVEQRRQGDVECDAQHFHRQGVIFSS